MGVLLAPSSMADHKNGGYGCVLFHGPSFEHVLYVDKFGFEGLFNERCLNKAGTNMSDEPKNTDAPEGSAPPTGFGSSSDEDVEYDLHLCLVPFIDLGLSFDHEAMLAEVHALEAEFLDEEQQGLEDRYAGGWASITLRNRGGVDGVRIYSEAQGQLKGDYAFTPLSQRCPLLQAFVEGLVDLEQCSEVHVLRLAPGGFVVPHADDPSRPVSSSISVALNMPEGCTFKIGLGAGGTQVPGAHEIPFEAGSGFVVNPSKVHAVQNDSEESRYHLIVRGTPKIPRTEVLEAARRQNQLEDLEALVRALVTTEQERGEAMADGTSLRELAAQWSLESLSS
jgi:hypothetical protein